MAWRSDGTGRRAKMEYTGNILEPDGGSVGDSVLAEFPDRRRYEISDMSVGDWRLLQAARKQASVGRITTKPPLWERTADSGARLTIKLRKDRQVLISLFQDARQICQVPAAAFRDTSAGVSFLEAPCGESQSRSGRVDTPQMIIPE